MKLKADEIASVIKQEIGRYRAELDVAEVGRVLEVGDGVARIFGLGQAMAGEMLEFQTGAVGLVFNLEENSIGSVVLKRREKRPRMAFSPIRLMMLGSQNGLVAFCLH